MSSHLPRILLVDDEPTNLLLLEELLESAGYETLAVESGNQALESAQNSLPDLILLDVMMPGMDGFEVCRRLRADRNLQSVPVIFLTALDDDESRLLGLEMMGDDYLTKPVNSNLLLKKISSTLRLNQLRSQQSERLIHQQVKEQSRHQISAAWQINEDLSEKFRLFVPDQFLNRIAPRGVESIQLGNAKEEELTILFCDIRGFTTISESQEAHETFHWINAFFTQMNQAVAANRGFIDKFLGDAIMAVFDQPGRHAQDAINAALMMLQSLTEFNIVREQYNLVEPINVGIGIHTGKAIIGTVGSSQRMDTTVIGDVVNTAARLEDLTKLYSCQVIVSDAVLAHICKDFQKNELVETQEISFPQCKECQAKYPSDLFQVRWIDRVVPRGKHQKLDLYEVLSTSTRTIKPSQLG